MESAFKKLANADINLIKEMIILVSFLFEITFEKSENQPTNSSFHVAIMERFVKLIVQIKLYCSDGIFAIGYFSYFYIFSPPKRRRRFGPFR